MSKLAADKVTRNLDVAYDAMRELYNELVTTNPIGAVYVLEQINAVNVTRNKMANVAGLLQCK